MGIGPAPRLSHVHIGHPLVGADCIIGEDLHAYGVDIGGRVKINASSIFALPSIDTG